MVGSISVIVPTYQYGNYIAEAIESALEQTVLPMEVIVVDDGSTDNTAEVVGEFGERVRYIRQDNSGVCAARNRGVAESRGDLIAFLDADDTWKSTKLEKQLDEYKRDPKIGFVHCGMREFDSKTGETIKIHLDGGEGWVANDIALWEKPVIIGPGGTIMIGRDVFEAVGGYDTRLKNGEDWEFCLRVAQKYKVGFVREPLVNYRSHGTNATKNVREMERSTLIAWDKVFNTDDPSLRKLRRGSYGNLHKVLAGSYLHIGDRSGFLRNLLKSLWYRPSYLAYYLTRSRNKKNKG